MIGNPNPPSGSIVRFIGAWWMFMGLKTSLAIMVQISASGPSTDLRKTSIAAVRVNVSRLWLCRRRSCSFTPGKCREVRLRSYRIPRGASISSGTMLVLIVPTQPSFLLGWLDSSQAEREVS